MRALKHLKEPRTPTPDEFAAWINPVPLIYETPEPDAWKRHALDRRDLLLAGALLLAALFVRWPLIDRGETLLHSDEAIVGLMAQDIAEGTRYPIYFYGQRYMGALEAYVIAALSPLFENPIHALRVGPALFFAALVAAQYLMLARWFGRKGGLAGAATLICAAPMFAQWSISARGGYIEILLWGTLLLWAYGTWFSERRTSEDPSPITDRLATPLDDITRMRRFEFASQALRRHRRRIRQFAFGALLGSGFWINPSIILFVMPVAAHRLLVPKGSAGNAFAARVSERLGLLTLPALVAAALVIVTGIWSVHVDRGRVDSRLLMGAVPRPVALAVLATALAAVGAIAQRRWNLIGRLREMARTRGMFLAGLLAGALPALAYLLGAVVGLHPLDPSLPLGLRPLWTVHETMSYIWHGLPLLFGADARPFMELVTIGRPSPIRPPDIIAHGLVRGANLLVLGAALTLAIALVQSYRGELERLFRLTPTRYSPAMFLLIGAAGTVVLFLVSGAAHDFNTIRYLIPLWAFLPGLVAAVVTHRHMRRTGRLASVALLGAWALGQLVMHRQLGAPHPLRPVADALMARQTPSAVAEIFDAHVLSYLTRQSCRVAEYEPFWSRLAHYQPAAQSGDVTRYVVLTDGSPAARGQRAWIHPGPPPPEVHRTLWPRLEKAIAKAPARLLSRESLASGYEQLSVRRKSD